MEEGYSLTAKDLEQMICRKMYPGQDELFIFM